MASDGAAGPSQVPHLYNKVCNRSEFSLSHERAHSFISSVQPLSLYALQMCGVLEDSGVSALNSFFGVKSASSSLASSLHQFETLCEGVVQALQPQQNGTASAIKDEEVVDANSKEAAALPQDSSSAAANEPAKADAMEIDG